VFAEGISHSALALLSSSPQPPFHSLLTLFINGLAQLSSKAILVLEDYHVITTAQVHETLTFFLDHLSPSLHLIMMTRSDPPLPLARLRARNELNELRAEDLRFSLSETQTFLEQALPFTLPAETISRLADRTEGWAAGLRLVSLALSRRGEQGDIGRFLDTFTGSHRPILDYLISDVFQFPTRVLQLFLLETSILSRLTGSLCDAITGRDDSAMIRTTGTRQSFLVSLDASQRWYRFHALFAEAMQYVAQQRIGASRLQELSNKASIWYEEHGMLSDAVEVALSTKAFPRAADLIDRIIPPQLIKNEFHTLRRWIAPLPADVLRPHPNLFLTYAIAIFFTSDRYSSETSILLQPSLQLAEQAWWDEGNRNKLGEVFAFRALVAWFQWNFVQAFADARQSLELLPEENVQWRGVSLIFVGLEELYAGRLHIAREDIHRGSILRGCW
jgi:LuxR family maltose regulon positive regulatory protein